MGPRFESPETGGRSRVRNKVKISILEDDDVDEEEESDTVPPTTASRGRLRSRFTGSSPRSLKTIMSQKRKIEDPLTQHLEESSIDCLDNLLQEEKHRIPCDKGPIQKKIQTIIFYKSRLSRLPD